ncbi:uncharacterized protein LOC34624181 [Cyclospora cayetanensis]|uniref:Uncharacterized protein LOC34624181 n=1 Tax=Cyclospora cayetanensis TaxID=88456 RepID=A0A6P6S2E3_9EIME|nr:uncharacterized protein LOC34624181 [Cyclospora cayetanensis]
MMFKKAYTDPYEAFGAVVKGRRSHLGGRGTGGPPENEPLRRRRNNCRGDADPRRRDFSGQVYSAAAVFAAVFAATPFAFVEALHCSPSASLAEPKAQRSFGMRPEILFSKEGPVWWSPEQPRISSASRLCGKELSSAEERAALEALHEASKNLHELSWTRLHTGHWEAVPLWCREAFAVACILLSFCYVSSAAVAVAAAEKHAAAGSAPQATVPPAAPAADRTATASEAVHADLSQTAEEGLRLGFRYVDLGLIMGGPKIRLYGPLTAAAAAFDDLRDQLLKLQQQRQRNASPNTRGSGGSSSSRDAAVPGRLAASCEAVVASCQEGGGEIPRGSEDAESLKTALGEASAHEHSDLPQVLIRRRRGSVEERTAIDFEEFLVSYLHKQKPLILRGKCGAARTWPCVKLWSDWSRLRRRLGHRLVPVEIGSSYAEEGWTQRLMAFEDFYNEFIGTPGGSPPLMGSCAQHQGRLTLCAAAMCATEGPPSSAGGPVGYLAQHALLEHLPFLAKEAPLPDLIEACTFTRLREFS